MTNLDAVKKYKHSKKGLLTTIYCSQKQVSITKNIIPPQYNKQELAAWLFNHPDFNKLFNNWVKSGFNKWEKPSIDRIDDYKPYLLSNIQLITWRENYTKYHKDIDLGNNRKVLRAVVQYDMNMKKISDYFSIKNAAKINNLFANGIRKCCIGEYKTSGGYIWRYANEQQ